jgi:hypothetical protein
VSVGEASEEVADLWSTCSGISDYWQRWSAQASGVIIDTTDELWSDILIACMMVTSEGSVREGLSLYGERRLADALGNKRYSSKIIKAGALLPDTKLLLETWDTDTDVENNLERVRDVADCSKRPWATSLREDWASGAAVR